MVLSLDEKAQIQTLCRSRLQLPLRNCLLVSVIWYAEACIAVHIQHANCVGGKHGMHCPPITYFTYIERNRFGGCIQRIRFGPVWDLQELRCPWLVERISFCTLLCHHEIHDDPAKVSPDANLPLCFSV